MTHMSERAKGAEKGSCGEAVVQTGVFGESVFFSAPSIESDGNHAHMLSDLTQTGAHSC